MANIIKTTAEVTLTTGKKRQMLRDAHKLIGRGIAQSFQLRMEVAAGLWNIRENKLHEIEEMTFDEYTAAILRIGEDDGMSRRTLYSLLQLGDRIRAVSMKHGGGTRPDITKKDVQVVFEMSSANITDFSVRGLNKAIVSTTAFENFLAGKSEEEAEMVKMLKPRKLSAEEIEQLAESERAGAVASDRAQSWGQAYAMTHNVHYNREMERWEHDDGTPLTKKEVAELTDISNALVVWDKTLEVVAQASADIYRAIALHGDLFAMMCEREVKKFDDLVDGSHKTIVRRIDNISQMIARLFDGDPEAAKQSYKNS
jgi:hypothetical protein